MTSARILTVRDPWATLIMKFGKTVENRSRNIAGDYRGPVLIHSAKHLVRDGDPAWTVAAGVGMDTDRYDGEEFFPGHIIGVVDLVDAHFSGECWGFDGDGEKWCSQWAQDRAHHLVLANPRALDQPIEYKGALGLRKTEFFVSGDWLGEYTDPDPKHGMCTPYGCPPSCYSEPAARLVTTS